MIEGFPPFHTKQENEVPKAYVANECQPFQAPAKCYAHVLKELIEECWSEEPFKRPPFRHIITRLYHINNQLAHKRRWKVSLSSFSFFLSHINRQGTGGLCLQYL
ncbi:hypothetical protein COLO4_08392 [Corchorus olitorius]|uniref:Serine-threonine/tyrosine-protein kinase catalytic domain-containing protein n=1 Tax=Corchorus olitorius TaxID=93759 RepID=A0A1R3KG05_9ROSI|nr:hypothetical protein COLO4_08392 [Corchorus olitorius]